MSGRPWLDTNAPTAGNVDAIYLLPMMNIMIPAESGPAHLTQGSLLQMTMKFLRNIVDTPDL